MYERFQQRSGTYNPEISNTDTEKAMIIWIKESQRELHDDVKAHRLVRLVPRYEEGVIMVGGRMERWMQDTWNRQVFVLLPYASRFSLLIAEYEHIHCGHIG